MTQPPKAGWTLAAVCLAAVLLTLDITIVNVALPEIASELSARLDGLQWAINGYTLAFAALLLTAGSVSDRVGRRAIFTAGVALFTAASAACGAAWSPGALTAFRIAQGVGGAMVMGTAMALIAGAYPAGRARQAAIGAFSAAGGAAAGLGPLIGGLLVDTLGWRWIFWINLPVGLVLVAGALLWLREPAREAPAGRIDVTGAVLAVVLLFALNYALIAGPGQGWGSPRVLAALLAGLLLLGLFVAVQARRSYAVLDVRLFRIPTFTGAVLLTFLARITSFGILPYLILWLQGMLGHSPLETGLRLLALTLPILVVAPLAGRLGEKLPASRLMAGGFALIAVAFVLMARVGPDSSWLVAFPGFVLLGVGGALAFPPLMGVTLDVVPRERAGMASGLSNTFFPLGTATGVAAFGAIFTTRIEAELPGQAAVVAGGRFDLVSQAAQETARNVFTGALATTCLVAAAAGLAGVAISLLLIRVRDTHPVPVG
ncbi:EmrB/QacA subfamily drug resistance transporter [Nonomuraea polychroma]|uniref:EmrB/QacA subfamily drug resistance transporter n=1 Tax=Nonomuraea polychroma TaxID=46176 RepID=A0A438M7H7_9ACTN|nr:MFS transporter [Nonomuraea polychroma]RVX41681.1 EmrB/QacA subfamily drug resistance transporter [Nonomuraea polychroma]